MVQSGAANPYKSDLFSTLDHSQGFEPKEMQEYKNRMAEFNEKLRVDTKLRNTKDLQNRLERLDFKNIDSKDEVQLQHLIDNAHCITMFALYNDHNRNDINFATLDKAVEAAKRRLKMLREGMGKTDFDKDIYKDAYAQKNQVLSGEIADYDFSRRNFMA